MPDLPPLLVIVGPTAVGKTAVALCVAERLGAEIVSADSMQVYRGMDIGTAKPTPEERARVPHHLIDMVEPDQEYSLAHYQRDATAAIAAIHARGRLPLLTGGTGLYVRAVVEGLNLPPAPPDPALRRRLEDLAAAEGVGAVHAMLAQVDPEAAARIPPANLKRVIRALEVYYQTGTPISTLHALDRKRPRRYNILTFGLDLPRAELYRNIAERVTAQLQRGLVEEVRRLLQRGYGEHLVSMQGLGYRQIACYLQGRCSREEAVARLIRDTRRYAKRQYTWFRADPTVRWLCLPDFGGVEGVCRYIVQQARAHFGGVPPDNIAGSE